MHGLGVRGRGDHMLDTRPVYRLSSAACLGQNRRGSRGQEWSLENGRERRTEYLSTKDQVTFESAVEGNKSQTTISTYLSTQRDNLNLFFKRKGDNQEERGNFYQYDLLALLPPNTEQ